MEGFDGLNLTAFQTIAGGFLAIIVAAAIFFRKIHAMVAADALSGTASNTQIELIDLLREQIRTFSDNNINLTQEVSSLRKENLNTSIESTTLKHQVEVMRKENEDLRQQVTLLRERVTQLTGVIEDLTKSLNKEKG